jgi:hypothetical protein
VTGGAGRKRGGWAEGLGRAGDGREGERKGRAEQAGLGAAGPVGLGHVGGKLRG